MESNQGGAMPDGDDGRVRQNLAQHAVDFRFQLLVKRRCRLIEEQPIRLIENSPRDSQTLLLAARKALGSVVLADNLTGQRCETGELQGFAHGLVTVGPRDGGVGHRGLQRARGYVRALRQ